MKSFVDFEKYMSTDRACVHDEIVAEVNKLVQKVNIEDKIEEQVFYYRAFSEISTMKILKAYHEWLNQE